MRYLYRAKRTDNGEWVEGYYFKKKIFKDSPAEEHFIMTSKEPKRGRICKVIFYCIDPSTICQCTGLKDKNGKLIWENDVVDIQHYAAKAHKVKWGYGGFYVGINGLLCHYNTVCEVIGNIFDNPELLEVGE